MSSCEGITCPEDYLGTYIGSDECGERVFNNKEVINGLTIGIETSNDLMFMLQKEVKRF